ncbi:glycosyltransferase family 4 protein [Bacillus pacificus]|uniref:glycosyltransferase family 4 protein n=1 Tax=Bacillus TaxID=1386 RepID=UPI00034CEBA1|nr:MULTISPECIES: glycosyltransferase family 4 protein [Bacillus cereus group]MCC2416553.1 glycosyltransferase family 4 protein [Bacillus pacificus]MCU5007375.1 glycosyltransferase family 4 protein [Bacillus pacificus]MCU5256451.1 glycosyltransferase family 4 protein [Bacillus pacificus]MCU5562670.1 glycosyltransferase family 4 protein [Bacillus pacificus]MDK7490041.1 glycosyltransferase family 4 protein [Bacillus paranthracis]
MKILYVITRSDWGGAQAHLFDLIREAKQKGYSCSVVVGEEGEFFNRVKELGVYPIYLKNLVHPIHPLKDFMATIKLKRIINEIKPDVIHLHSSKAGVIGRIAGAMSKVPVIFTAHGWAFSEGVSSKRKAIAIPIEKGMGYLSDNIICVSEYDKRLALQNKISTSRKLVTIYNGVKDKQIHENNSSKKNGILKVIMVARFSYPKDYETLIRAVDALDIPIEVNLLGNGDLQDQMKKLANDLGVCNKVNFLGMQRDVTKYLAESDVFILTTNYEGLPISIIEAMQQSLPIIATNVGGVGELVEHGKNGFLIAKQDVKGVVKYLEKFNEDRILAKQMGKVSRRKYEESFDLEICMEKTFEVYQKVIKSNG